MKNLENAVFFNMSAVPFIIEKDFRMIFGETVFEPVEYKNKTANELIRDFYSGKDIKVKYSIHLDNNYPYKEFKIHYISQDNTISGDRL